MPEGPSIALMRQEAIGFEGRTIDHASGSASIDMPALAGQRIEALRTWGKHFLIVLPDGALRIHLLLFGSYCIDARKDKPPRLALAFRGGGELNFYSCAVRRIDEPLDAVYDWRVDTLSDAFDGAQVRRLLRALGDAPVCDALLDQDVFAGAGNIFKNEVLWRVRVHPLSPVAALPAAKLAALVREVRRYAFEFLFLKQAGALKASWQAHRQRTCTRCDVPLHKDHLGAGARASYFCTRCQILHA